MILGWEFQLVSIHFYIILVLSRVAQMITAKVCASTKIGKDQNEWPLNLTFWLAWKIVKQKTFFFCYFAENMQFLYRFLQLTSHHHNTQINSSIWVSVIVVIANCLASQFNFSLLKIFLKLCADIGLCRQIRQALNGSKGGSTELRP